MGEHGLYSRASFGACQQHQKDGEVALPSGVPRSALSALPKDVCERVRVHAEVDPRQVFHNRADVQKSLLRCHLQHTQCPGDRDANSSRPLSGSPVIHQQVVSPELEGQSDGFSFTCSEPGLSGAFRFRSDLLNPGGACFHPQPYWFRRSWVAQLCNDGGRDNDAAKQKMQNLMLADADKHVQRSCVRYDQHRACSSGERVWRDLPAIRGRRNSEGRRDG